MVTCVKWVDIFKTLRRCLTDAFMVFFLEGRRDSKVLKKDTEKSSAIKKLGDNCRSKEIAYALIFDGYRK